MSNWSDYLDPSKWSSSIPAIPVDKVHQVADTIDSTVHQVSRSIRGTLSNASWLPESARPTPPPPPPSLSIPVRGSTLDGVYDWVEKNKYTVGLGLVGLATTAWGVGQVRKSHRRRRRARRAANGAREEVLIVIADVVMDELARAVVLDLERRGFVVFVIAGSERDEAAIREIGKKDVRSLKVDAMDFESTSRALNSFTTFLSTPQRPAPSIPAHTHTLSGVLLFPSSSYPTGPIELLPPSTLSNVLTQNILSPLLQTQFLLPLLRQYHASLTILSPSIIHSTTTAFHAPEAIVTSALEGWAKTLSRELKSSGVKVCRVRVGNVDFAHAASHVKRRRGGDGSSASSAGSSVFDPGEGRRSLLTAYEEDELIRDVYARTYRPAPKGRGTSVKEVCREIFDIVEDGTRGVRYVGRGSWVYEWLGWSVGGKWNGRDFDEDGWEQI